MEVRQEGGTVRTRPIAYKRGLFQGDSLSPLLFCLSVLPLSHALGKSTGYRIRRSTLKISISHMLYMDDLKVYAETPAALNETLSVVDRVASAVGMKLGLKKCGTAHLKKGKVLPGPDNPNPEPDSMRCLSPQDTYRYLGIDQLFETDDKLVKDRVICECRKRLHKIWKSQLYSKNKVDATNALAVSLLRYCFVTVKWTRKELQGLDILTRKVLRRYQSHHLNASSERLYLPRSQGGRGLQSLLLVWEQEIVSHAIYLVSSRDPLMEAVRKHSLLWAEKSTFSLFPTAGKILRETGREVEWSANPTLGRMRILQELRKAQMSQLQLRADHKSHQGKFLSDVRSNTSLNVDLSFRWMCKGQLRSTTESLIIAAQDDCLYTRSFKANCMKQAGVTHCRHCGEGIETIKHILNQCKKKGFNLYMERHNKALQVVYYDICRHYGFEVPLRWWEVSPVPVTENERAKVLWDVPIPTDIEIVARRPDILLQDKETRKLYIIDMAVAWDSIQTERHGEKLSKYGPFSADLRRQFPGYSVVIVPVVLGSLGVVSNHLVEDLCRLPPYGVAKAWESVTGMQRSVLCSIVQILRTHLTAAELVA